ncbi:MAG: ester cyclase [Chloroflexi bacterium]|nr:ester cyclase [Chloroflexota bacterium]
MPAEDNKALVRRLVEEVWNRGNLAAIDELVALSHVRHIPAPDPQGPQGYKQWVTRTRTAFPDFHFTIEDLVAEGDRVMVRGTWRGTLQGELQTPWGSTIPPTGRKLVCKRFSCYRLASGKLLEEWALQDWVGVLQQVGTLPMRA